MNKPPHAGQKPDHVLSSTARLPSAKELRALEQALSNNERSLTITAVEQPIDAVDHASGQTTYLPYGYLVTIRERQREGGPFELVAVDAAAGAIGELCAALHIETPDIQALKSSQRINTPHVFVGARTMGKLCDAATKGRSVA